MKSDRFNSNLFDGHRKFLNASYNNHRSSSERQLDTLLFIFDLLEEGEKQRFYVSVLSGYVQKETTNLSIYRGQFIP